MKPIWDVKWFTARLTRGTVHRSCCGSRRLQHLNDFASHAKRDSFVKKLKWFCLVAQLIKACVSVACKVCHPRVGLSFVWKNYPLIPHKTLCYLSHINLYGTGHRPQHWDAKVSNRKEDAPALLQSQREVDALQPGGQCCYLKMQWLIHTFHHIELKWKLATCLKSPCISKQLKQTNKATCNGTAIWLVYLCL